MPRSLVFIMLWTLTTSSAPAEIIVRVQNASISAGGTGYVDVLISSTGTNPLQFGSYEFLISGSAANGALQFRESQLNTEQFATSVTDVADYVFLGDTDSGNFSAIRNPGNFLNLTGSDSTFSGTNIAGDLNTGVFALLARLELEHITGAPLAAVGDTFTLQLINTDPDPFEPLDDSTLFLDEAGDIQNIAGSSFTHFGTITITSAAVPEPGTVGFMSLAALAFIVRQRRRRTFS